MSGVQLNTPVRNPGAQNRENSYPQNYYNLPPSRTQNPRSSPPRPPRSQNNLPPRTQYPHNSAGINSNSYRKRPGLGTGKFDTTRINSVEDLEKHPEIKKNLEKVAKNTNVISALFEVSTKLHWTPPNFKGIYILCFQLSYRTLNPIYSKKGYFYESLEPGEQGYEAYYIMSHN